MSCIPWFWVFQKLGLYRITDGRPGKRIVSEYYFIILYILLYLNRKENRNRTSTTDHSCLPAAHKEGQQKTVGAIWGEFCHFLWNATDFNIFSPGGFFGVTHRAVNGIHWGAKGSNQKRTNITTCNVRPVILI